MVFSVWKMKTRDRQLQVLEKCDQANAKTKGTLPSKPLPPILPGYRPPFNSETGKAASIKGHIARQLNRQARQRSALEFQKAGQIPSATVEIAALISASLRQYRRCMAACVASTSGKEAAQWARAAKDAFECWQSLLGHNPKSHKSTKKPHLAHVAPMAKVAPISTIQSVSPVDQSASGVKAEGMISPESGVCAPLPVQDVKSPT
jgi:hypothetical protein